jgi:DNA-binding MarR family transcriptional regulator
MEERVDDLRRLRRPPGVPAGALAGVAGKKGFSGMEATSAAAGVAFSTLAAMAGTPEALLTSALNPVELRAWRAFLSRHARVARRLEVDLIARSDLPLAEYDVLFQLALAEGQRLRMNELADRVLLSRAGITRLVDRLMADGLVGRLKCASDARGYYAVLTPDGMTRLLEATPAHMAAVRRFFLDSFTASELETLAELLERTRPLD